jgi:hypothetical protein
VEEVAGAASQAVSARGRFIFSARGRFILNDRAWLAAICASELGTLLVFSNFSPLLPLLQREWRLSNSEAGLIVSFYQFGYIGAVMILATLTDYMPPRRIYLASAFWTAAASLGFAFWANGFFSAVLLRGAVGLGLAGTYMPGMRMVAERFAHGGRGFAMGCYIGTFTLGTAVSLFVTGWANGLWGWRWAFALTAAGPFLAARSAGSSCPGMATMPAAARPPRDEERPARCWRTARQVRLITAYGAHTFELRGHARLDRALFHREPRRPGAGSPRPTSGPPWPPRRCWPSAPCPIPSPGSCPTASDARSRLACSCCSRPAAARHRLGARLALPALVALGSSTASSSPPNRPSSLRASPTPPSLPSSGGPWRSSQRWVHGGRCFALGRRSRPRLGACWAPRPAASGSGASGSSAWWRFWDQSRWLQGVHALRRR